ncbi:MAG: FmdB family zinc ribbon protein [Trinickia sp.]|jgi:putative FmdB family regulatory protein
MPIYAYRCESCGFEKDVLQKMSDAPLTQCPQCEKDTFRKQVTAAGFQLKGSGWYVTDFRGGSTGAKGAASGGAAAATSDTKPEAKSESKPDSASAQPASTSAPASSDA